MFDVLLSNPYEMFAQAHCGKLSKHRSLGHKVKGASKHIERFRSTVQKHQLHDCQTFHNWWQYFANGRKPHSYFELQRQRCTNRRFVDQIKDQDAAKFFKFFLKHEPEIDPKIIDNELLNCFNCPCKEMKRRLPRKTQKKYKTPGVPKDEIVRIKIRPPSKKIIRKPIKPFEARKSILHTTLPLDTDNRDKKLFLGPYKNEPKKLEFKNDGKTIPQLPMRQTEEEVIEENEDEAETNLFKKEHYYDLKGLTERSGNKSYFTLFPQPTDTSDKKRDTQPKKRPTRTSSKKSVSLKKDLDEDNLWEGNLDEMLYKNMNMKKRLDSKRKDFIPYRKPSRTSSRKSKDSMEENLDHFYDDNQSIRSGKKLSIEKSRVDKSLNRVDDDNQSRRTTKKLSMTKSRLDRSLNWMKDKDDRSPQELSMSKSRLDNILPKMIDGFGSLKQASMSKLDTTLIGNQSARSTKKLSISKSDNRLTKTFGKSGWKVRDPSDLLVRISDAKRKYYLQRKSLKQLSHRSTKKSVESFHENLTEASKENLRDTIPETEPASIDSQRPTSSEEPKPKLTTEEIDLLNKLKERYNVSTWKSAKRPEKVSSIDHSFKQTGRSFSAEDKARILIHATKKMRPIQSMRTLKTEPIFNLPPRHSTGKFLNFPLRQRTARLLSKIFKSKSARSTKSQTMDSLNNDKIEKMKPEEKRQSAQYMDKVNSVNRRISINLQARKSSEDLSRASSILRKSIMTPEDIMASRSLLTMPEYPLKRSKSIVSSSSSIFWKIATIGRQSDVDLERVTSQVYPPMDVELYVNNFIESLDLDKFKRSPKFWPRTFESQFVQDFRRKFSKNCRRMSTMKGIIEETTLPKEASSHSRKTLHSGDLKKDKSHKGLLPEMPKKQPTPLDLWRMRCCEICSSFDKVEPDKPYMIEMRERQAKEELKKYYRCSLVPPPVPKVNQQTELNNTQSITEKLKLCYEILTNCADIVDYKLRERDCLT